MNYYIVFLEFIMDTNWTLHPARYFVVLALTPFVAEILKAIVKENNK